MHSFSENLRLAIRNVAGEEQVVGVTMVANALAEWAAMLPTWEPTSRPGAKITDKLAGELFQEVLEAINLKGSNAAL